MDINYVPLINCRFRIRRDIDCLIAFFATRGVLTTDEIGGFILFQINGEHNLGEIADLVGKNFPEVEDPLAEVEYVVEELQFHDLL